MGERRYQDAGGPDTSKGSRRDPRDDQGATASSTEEGDLSAPLVSRVDGRLIFAGGAAGLKLRSDATSGELFRARFERHVPKVSVEGNTVRVDYGQLPIIDWLRYWRKPLADVVLNGSVPWRVEVRGGATNVDADLRWMELLELEIVGGASQVVLSLPRPSGTVAVRVDGGASNLTVYRPIGVAARVHVKAGANDLTLDDQQLGGVGGPVRWQSPDYGGASDRYNVQITGGANHLTIDSR